MSIKILDDIIFAAECNKLVGVRVHRTKIPMSASSTVLKGFDELKINYTYKGVENTDQSKESNILYDIILPNNHDCGGDLSWA